MNILIIAPHPDDEVLGCGGTMALHAKRNDDVYLCIVTKREGQEWPREKVEGREEHINAASKTLGVKETFCLGFPDGRLDTVPQREFNDALLDVVNKTRPDIMYIPNRNDVHDDHRRTYQAALVASRPGGGHEIKKILSYESGWVFPNTPFAPTVFTDIKDTLDTKLAAMQEYKTEAAEYPHLRSPEAIRAMAMRRGSYAGLEYAEAFELVREIVV
ncbi:MAG: PIG-L family deacetylase [Thermoplasmata archaeon]|nr:PIG-L family deacetylase [Thermoplasmata archaeon]